MMGGGGGGGGFERSFIVNFERTFADQVLLTELYTIQGLSRYRT